MQLLAKDRETKEEYRTRVDRMKDICQWSAFSDAIYISLADSKFAKVLEQTNTIYGFRLDSLCVVFSNQHLPFWCGGMTWMYDVSEQTGVPLVQLRKRFFRKDKMWGYSREEILIHEMLHVFREQFSGNRFEEILAYHSSTRRLRRYLGPLFRSSLETYVFSILSVFPWMSWFFFSSWMGSYILSVYAGWLIVSLYYHRFLLRKSLKKIRQLFPMIRDPMHLVICLSEEEILLFARASLSELSDYIANKKSSSLRWALMLEQMSLTEH